MAAAPAWRGRLRSTIGPVVEAVDVAVELAEITGVDERDDRLATAAFAAASLASATTSRLLALVMLRPLCAAVWIRSAMRFLICSRLFKARFNWSIRFPSRCSKTSFLMRFCSPRPGAPFSVDEPLPSVSLLMIPFSRPRSMVEVLVEAKRRSSSMAFLLVWLLRAFSMCCW